MAGISPLLALIPTSCLSWLIGKQNIEGNAECYLRDVFQVVEVITLLSHIEKKLMFFALIGVRMSCIIRDGYSCPSVCCSRDDFETSVHLRLIN